MADKDGNGTRSTRRVVVVDGVRTPFVKAFGALMKMDTIALGAAAVRGLLERTPGARDAVDAIVWGGVILPSAAPNVGREIALDLGLRPDVEARTVTRACASGLQAITDAAASIALGEVDVVIAGGSDSTSNARLELPQSLVHKLAPVALSGKSKPLDYVRALSTLNLVRDLVPKRPEIAERTTGEVMGQAAERMAERHGISREAQDRFAARSHQRAAAATASGRFAAELVSVETPSGERVERDTLVREDTSEAKLAKLRPAFKKDGTLTAGNSSPLTDGAAAVLLMSEDKARKLGVEPLAVIESWAYVGVDPRDQLLIGPALAIPRVLKRTGHSLAEMDRIDLHEAFAAQVLCVTKMLESDAFARERLGREAAVGEVDEARLNVHGGSVAIGHPFGATGARMVATMSHELALTNARRAILGICAAGGLGAAAILSKP